ncbi:MAG: hypothetical protein OCC46_00895 [Pseudodesulfovibrio sp.]
MKRRDHTLLNICGTLVWVLFVFLVLHPSSAKAELILPVPADSDTISRYHALLEEKGKSAEELTEIRSNHSTRGIAALVIIKQALLAAGMNVEFKFIEVPNAARERLLVREGEAVIAGQDLFSIAFTDDVYMSSAIIPTGSFVKGVYCSKNNFPVLRLKTLADLQQFVAVSFSGWKVDWATLQGLELAGIRNVPKPQTMFKLVQFRDGDFTLWEFPATKDLSQKLGDIELIPVPGVKIALKGSRHFMISKKHPDGLRVFEALEQGLTILRKKGLIEQYLTDCGFYTPAVADWTVLNP